MRIDVVTIFPEMFAAIRESGMTRRALAGGQFELCVWNPRQYSGDNYRRVDDRPYGGGPGMVMMAEPLAGALDAARQAAGGRVIYLTPQGRPLTQSVVGRLALEPALVLLAGRYEGVDERLIETEVDEELSIGDYVLSGGELPAMVLVEALVRCLPGVLGNEESAQDDSFSSGLLDWPQYTRPEQFAGHEVPAVLLGGNHGAIRRWRLKQALGRTWLRRPDLLAGRELNDEEQELLESFKNEQKEMENSR